MLIFALIHSITADKRIKQGFARFGGERVYHGWYRLLYNILALLLLAPLFPYMWSISTPLYQVPQPFATLFTGIQGIGTIGLCVSLLQIDFLRFAGLRQVLALMQNKPLPLPNEPLQTGGLYGWVRHPLYFFSLLTLWFAPTMTNAAFVFNIAATLYFTIGSRIEEQRMVRAYGESYIQYQQRVAWMIPLLRFRK